MARLLYLVHRMPYPPNKGDKIRSYNILKHLAAQHDVVLGTFIDDPDDRKHQATVEALCAASLFEDINPKTGKVKSLRGLLTGEALSVAFYASRTFQNWVDQQISSGDIDAIVLFSSAMARFVPWEKVSGISVMMDFVDMDSDKWAQYAQSKSGPAAWIYGREARRLFDFEKEIALKATSSSFVTQAEVDLFKRRIAPQTAEIIAIPNGVDLEHFHPDYGSKVPGPEMEIVFTGAMDYWANVDAVIWFTENVLPQIQASLPEATFTIVGSKPTAQVKDLSRLPGVSVTGFVEDTRDYIARAQLCVAPMRIARGVQNKVLEGMAMGKAVLTSPQGFEGIVATPGRDVVVEENTDAFAAAAINLLQNKDKAGVVGKAARTAMEKTYAWDAALQPFDDFLRSSGKEKL